jgi:hypothetical protein
LGFGLLLGGQAFPFFRLGLRFLSGRIRGLFLALFFGALLGRSGFSLSLAGRRLHRGRWGLVRGARPSTGKTDATGQNQQGAVSHA